MNLRLAIGPAALLCGLLASCYPYDEQAQRTKPKKAPQTKTEQQVKPKSETAAAEQPATGSESTSAISPSAPQLNVPALPGKSPTTTSKPATTASKPEYPYANKVPGKDGFVFSPYNQKVVDVRDIPSGTLVQDPTYPAAEKKYFRVP
jgi:hypothetical protein